MANSFVDIHKRHCGDAINDLLHRPLGNLLTIAVLAVALSLPATFYLLAKNLIQVASEWQNPAQVTVYLKQSVSSEEGQALTLDIAQWPQVSDASYVSPNEGLEELRSMQGFEQAVSLLDENPLPAVIVIVPKETEQDAELTSQQLVDSLTEQGEIEEVRIDNDWLQRFAAIKAVVTTLTWVFSGLMFGAVFLVVGNTLRLHVLNQHDRIQVMKLVGATDSYILRPYLYMGALLGVIAAVIAWLITAVNTLLLDMAVAKLAALYDSGYQLAGLRWDESLILIMLAVLFGVLAARLATGRHLKEIEPV